jgi:extracellular factor (EF) 3-hydroxypalmitic acid methyl ester biosynthesis protein
MHMSHAPRTAPIASTPSFPLLDAHAAALSRDPSAAQVHALIRDLDALRRSLPVEAWRAFAAAAQAHPLAAMVADDPYTRRAREKPRGYAGDAVMLDYVYDPDAVDVAALSPQGRATWAATTDAPSAEAVRDRRRRLAALVDEVAAARPGASVVSVAAGHAREIERSAAFARGEVARWRCLDQDRESLAAIAARHRGDARVEPAFGSVRDLLARGLPESADLVYSAGLFDYLRDDVASALLQRLWHSVREGGRLVVANFADDSGERGYMEAMMDWWLLYRDEASIAALGATLEGATVRVFRDTTGRTVWLEATRGAATGGSSPGHSVA